VNAALVETLLTGVALPASRDELVAYARQEGADRDVVEALDSLRAHEYRTLNAVGDELRSVQPAPLDTGVPTPRGESGEPPGGRNYIGMRNV
jgi:hypothetical protein